jgi:hypothetical protein
VSVETIKCRECGSSDVTEFKAGTYVCGHCESVFKRVVPPEVTEATGCQIDSCGVPAVGRCHVCTRRFCGTHQAGEVWPPRRYSDWCVECRESEVAAREATERETQLRIEELGAILGTFSDLEAIRRAASDPLSKEVEEGVVARAWKRYVQMAGVAPTHDYVGVEHQPPLTVFGYLVPRHVVGTCFERRREGCWLVGEDWVDADGRWLADFRDLETASVPLYPFKTNESRISRHFGAIVKRGTAVAVSQEGSSLCVRGALQVLGVGEKSSRDSLLSWLASGPSESEQKVS